MLLKRYKNRKLYSIDTSEYMQFQNLTDSIIENMYVLCDRSKEDATVSVLKGMLAARILSMDYADAMAKSGTIIARLNNYVPNTSMLIGLQKRIKYDKKSFTDTLQEVTS